MITIWAFWLHILSEANILMFAKLDDKIFNRLNWKE